MDVKAIPLTGSNSILPATPAILDRPLKYVDTYQIMAYYPIDIRGTLLELSCLNAALAVLSCELKSFSTGRLLTNGNNKEETQA
jgi:hypothetical protein